MLKIQIIKYCVANEHANYEVFHVAHDEEHVTLYTIYYTLSTYSTHSRELCVNARASPISDIILRLRRNEAAASELIAACVSN